MAPVPTNRRRPPKPGDQRQRSAQRRGKPKFCAFCAQRLEWVDYKDVNMLRRFLSERGKIRPRENTGTCKQHQRDLAVAIKTARELALVPYAVSVPVADRQGGRGGRGGPRGDGRARPDGDGATGVGTSTEGGSDGQVRVDVGEAPAGGGESSEGEGET
jgi:small subunit ribosomal protein S18